MNQQINPTDLVQSDIDFSDQICQECKALIVTDPITNEPLCNCLAETEKLAQIAKAQTEQKTTVQKDPSQVAPQAEIKENQENNDQPVMSAKIMLKAIPGAPTQDQIEAWKQEFGTIYTFPFDTNEIYIWRPMRRREWQMLQTNKALVEDEAKFQEQVIMRAVLWPNIGPVELNLSRAGLVQTLFSVIMQGSYFLHPEFAISLVEEL